MKINQLIEMIFYILVISKFYFSGGRHHTMCNLIISYTSLISVSNIKVM